MPQSSIRQLTPKLKYTIFNNHFKPTSNYKFPSHYVDGCNRSCQYQYFVDNPWFVYSKMENGIFCLPCVLFASKPDLGQFVNEKFKKWSKKSRKFADHNHNQYHKFALVRMEALKSSINNPCSSVNNQLQKVTNAKITNNRYIIKCIAENYFVAGNALLCVGIGMIVLLLLVTKETSLLFLIIVLSLEM